eukprot:scaffold63560_cov42-Attheya_sp.AAC.2
MSADKWEILEPTKWLRTVIKTEVLSMHTGRVWLQKINGEIKAYHETIDKHIETEWKTTSNPSEVLQSITGNNPWTSWGLLNDNA